jgi:hypothetical protein
VETVTQCLFHSHQELDNLFSDFLLPDLPRQEFFICFFCTGDGHDHAGARKCPQNDPWGMVTKKTTPFYMFYSLPIENIAPICLQIPSNVKVTLGKSFLLL